MIAGKLKDVVQGFDSLEELVNRVNEGYVLLSWREKSDIMVSYLLVKNRKVVGLVVENVITREVLQGNAGLEILMSALKLGRIRVAEIYEAGVDEILKAYPSSVIEWKETPSELPGSDIEGVLRLASTYSGTVEVHDGSKSWAIYMERGVLKKARTLSGPEFHGDDAVKDLLREMGGILDHGKYRLGTKVDFSSRDSVKEGTKFREGLEILTEKLDIEKRLKKEKR